MKSFLFILFILTLQNSFAQTISSVEFDGLTKTKESYLRSLIATKVNAPYDSTVIGEDVFLLRNLNLFFHVESSDSIGSDSLVQITFHIKEANYFYPIFGVTGFKGQLKLTAGMNQINFLGRAQNLGVIYQYYDRHSIAVFHSQKRHRNKLTGHDASLSKYSSVEPLYYNDTVSSFNFDNYSGSAGIFFWLNNYTSVGVGGQYMVETLEQLDDAFDFGAKQFTLYKTLGRTSLEFNKIEYIYEMLEGINAKIYGEYIGTKNHPEASFLKLTSKISWYKMVGYNGNLALNSNFGIATNNQSPFSPFVLDGLTNVRGVGNRVERGTAEWIVNMEYRHTVYRNDYFAIQAAVFTDYGTIRTPGEMFNTFFEKPEMHVYSGGGIRFNLKKWYNTCLRVDYSVNLTNTKQSGFTFGFGQFF